MKIITTLIDKVGIDKVLHFVHISVMLSLDCAFHSNEHNYNETKIKLL